MKWYKSASLNCMNLILVATEEDSPVYSVVYVDASISEPIVKKYHTFEAAEAVFFYILDVEVGLLPEQLDFNYTPDTYPEQFVL